MGKYVVFENIKKDTNYFGTRFMTADNGDDKIKYNKEAYKLIARGLSKSDASVLINNASKDGVDSFMENMSDVMGDEFTEEHQNLIRNLMG